MTLAPAHFQQYRALRLEMIDIHSQVFKTLSKEEVQSAALRLGLLVGDTMCFPTEDAMAVLMDHAIYDSLRDGRPVVHHFWDGRAPAADGDEVVIRNAMTRAWFSLWRVTEIHPGYGVELEDAMTRQRLFFMDHGMSRTAVVDGFLATRCLPFPDFCATSGVGIPIQFDMLPGLVDILQEAVSEKRGHHHDAEGTGCSAQVMTATVLRHCLRVGAMDYVRHEDPPQAPRMSRFAPGSALLPNSPCPCGSGRSYKKCCRRRR